MFRIQQLDTLTLALGGSGSIPLRDCWKRIGNGDAARFTRIFAIDLEVAGTFDQASSGGSTVKDKHLKCILASIGLSSAYEPYGQLLEPMNGELVGYLMAGYLLGGQGNVTLSPCADIASSDGDTSFKTHIPLVFGDLEYQEPEDFCLAPQGLVGDSISVTAGAAADVATFSTGAVFKGSVVITPRVYFTTSDEAQVPVVRRWRVKTRTTERANFGRGRFTHVIGLSDLMRFGGADGMDTINTITILRNRQALTQAVNAFCVARSLAAGALGAVSFDQMATGAYPVGGAWDLAATEHLPIIVPQQYGLGGGKVTDTIADREPLELVFGEDSVGGANKLLYGVIVEKDETRAAQMARDLYGIAAPSVTTKRLRPGTADAELAPEKKAVLPWSARTL